MQIIDILCGGLPAEGKVLMAQKLSHLCGGISDEEVLSFNLSESFMLMFVFLCCIGQAPL